MVDLLTFACCKMGFPKPDYVSSKRAVEEFLKKPVKDLIDVSGRNHYYSLPHTAKFQEILQILSKPNIHRVIINNEAGDVVGILTQSSLIAFLHKNKDKMSTLVNQSINTLFPIGEKKVQTVDFDMFVIDALRQLVEKEISGIAVVDNEGKIIGNLSASDLKRMSVDQPLQLCYDIYESIKIFMNYSGDQDKPHNDKLPRFDPVLVNADDSLGKVLDTIVTKHIHRVYVADKNNIPTGEISLCDVIQRFLGVASP